MCLVVLSPMQRLMLLGPESNAWMSATIVLTLFRCFCSSSSVSSSMSWSRLKTRKDDGIDPEGETSRALQVIGYTVALQPSA